MRNYSNAELEKRLKDLKAELMQEAIKEAQEHEHHHHDHEEHEHHHHDHEEHEHHHDGECCCGHHHDHEEHEHHYDENGVCSCGHHHHHADEVFGSWGKETPAKYTKSDIEAALDAFEDNEEYGIILRAKGMVPDENGGWIYFDYVPGEKNVRAGEPDVTGKICVIGSKLDEDKLDELFRK